MGKGGHRKNQHQNPLNLFQTKPNKVKVLKSKSFKSFSDEAYGFIWCGGLKPPHKVKVKTPVHRPLLTLTFVWRLQAATPYEAVGFV
ncbi:MAG: hypothetical protein LBH93_07055 [Chitinispirillales bacterium]|jgi:hypothetical protein|nr:hypothetical protein [Chitinispirillales bacterium]